MIVVAIVVVVAYLKHMVSMRISRVANRSIRRSMGTNLRSSALPRAQDEAALWGGPLWCAQDPPVTEMSRPGLTRE